MDFSTFLYIFDLIGTFAFALSGGIAAVRKEMDLYGILILAIVTSLGGGILRDLFIGRIPPLFFIQPAYLLVACFGGFVVFFMHRWIEHFYRPLVFVDAVGLGVFTVIGVAVAADAEISWYGSVLMGVITGTAGGMIRDLLRQEIPLVLRREVYAAASLVGAFIYFAALSLHIPNVIAAPFCALIVAGLRIVSVRKDWHLPRAWGKST